MTTIAPWLKRHLEDAGVWNADSVSRKAKARRCKDCRQVVIVGLDSDTAASAVIVDPDPLTALGEALAQIGGRSTYDLYARMGLSVEYRDAITISRSPAGTGETDTVAEHQCHSPPLPSMASKVPPPAQLDTSAEPPF